jgi:hypothetical protein
MRQRLLQLLSTCAALAAIACVEPPPYPTIIKAEVSTDAQSRDANADDAIAPDDASHQDLAAPVPGVCEALECPGAPAPCTVVAAVDGSPCEDGDPCTVDDTCLSGTCTAGLPAYRERFFGDLGSDPLYLSDLAVMPNGRRALFGASAYGNLWFEMRGVILLEGTDGDFEPQPHHEDGLDIIVSGTVLATGNLIAGGYTLHPELGLDFSPAVQVTSPRGAMIAAWDGADLGQETEGGTRVAVSVGGSGLVAWHVYASADDPTAGRFVTLTYTDFLSVSAIRTLAIDRRSARLDAVARDTDSGYWAAGRFSVGPGSWMARLDDDGTVVCSADLGGARISETHSTPSGGVLLLGSVVTQFGSRAFVGEFDSECDPSRLTELDGAPADDTLIGAWLSGDVWMLAGQTALGGPDQPALGVGGWLLDLAGDSPKVGSPVVFAPLEREPALPNWILGRLRPLGGGRVAGVGAGSSASGHAAVGWLAEFAAGAPAECYPVVSP